MPARPGGTGVAEVGGLFMATKDVARLVAWYRELGIPLGDDGTHRFGPAQGPGSLAFSIQKAAGELPATGGDLHEDPYGMQRLTLSLRVHDLDATVAKLGKAHADVIGPRDHGYGRIAWTKDPDGNVVELWQAAAPRANP